MDLQSVVDAAHVAPEVFDLRPDYRVLLVAADGLAAGPGDASSEALLARAEDAARCALAEAPVTELPHVAAWREAYRAFGAKPQRTRNSLEALVRRAEAGLPRVNRLTGLYNAISVIHQVPLGGEDLAHYRGAPRLIRATGTEPFDTVDGGEAVIDHPEAGEVVWADDAGVTCRRWNWRQGRRTGLSDSTDSALFIFDALAPMDDGALQQAADDLLAALGPGIRSASRLIGRGSAT